MSGLKGRIDKLYAGTISAVTSKITVQKNDQILKQSRIGNNAKKVIEIIIKL